MKQYILTLAIIITISACNGQTGYKEAKKVQKAIEDAPRPGTMPAKNGSWTMTALVNGKQWTATSVMPPAAAGRLVGYEGGKSYIGLPAFEKRYVKVGAWYLLGDGHYSVDIWYNNDASQYRNYAGKVEVTKIDDDWVEGTFYFTATRDEPVGNIKVTNGFFRVQL